MPFKNVYVPTKKFTRDFSLSSNPFGPSPRVKQALMQALSGSDSLLSPYPETGYPALLQAIADFHRVCPEQIILGAGLDGLIFDTINALLGPDDELVLPAVTFENALYAAIAQGARVQQVPMKSDFSVDFDQLIKSINPKTKIVFLCNPNNPTGIYEPLTSIVRLLESTQAFVVLDEANIEFSGGSAISLIERFPHFMVLRTFSKAYGLAGIRVGYGISRSPLLKKTASARPPFFISTLSAIAAQEALLDQDYVHSVVEKIIHERTFLERELNVLGFTVIPSQSNTVLCRIPSSIASASCLIEQLNRYDFHVVNGTHFNLPDCYVRIAPKVHEANEQLLGALRHILGK